MTDLPQVPISVDAEQAVLGAVLMTPDAYFLTADIVDAECFSEPLHGKLWDMAADRIEAGRKADPVSMVAAMGPDAKAPAWKDGPTLQQYIVSIASNAVGTVAVVDYARTVRDLATRRRLMAFGHELQHRAAGGMDDTDLNSMLEEADREFGAIRFGKKTPGIVWLHEAADEALRLTATNYEAQGKIRIGLETGIPELDDMIGPLMGGDLVTILAPSGHGKSALVTQILCAASSVTLDANQSRPAFFVSQEMPAAQVARRVMASMTRIPTRKQRAGEVDESQFEALADAARAARQVRVLFDESGRQKVSTIARKARAMKRLHGIGSMAVDHLLLIQPENPRIGKIETIENAAMVLKDLAKELGIVIFQLAQLTRESQKESKSWRFSSGALYGGDMVKQASDVMLGLSIPVEWLKERKPNDFGGAEGEKWLRQYEDWKGKAELGTLKLRDDESAGWKSLPFDGPTMLFGTRA